jgi:hypothetical protein
MSKSDHKHSIYRGKKWLGWARWARLNILSSVLILKLIFRANFKKICSLQIVPLPVSLFMIHKKISFGEGKVQDFIPALPGIGSKIPAVVLGDTYS